MHRKLQSKSQLRQNRPSLIEEHILRLALYTATCSTNFHCTTPLKHCLFLFCRGWVPTRPTCLAVLLWPDAYGASAPDWGAEGWSGCGRSRLPARVVCSQICMYRRADAIQRLPAIARCPLELCSYHTFHVDCIMRRSPQFILGHCWHLTAHYHNTHPSWEWAGPVVLFGPRFFKRYGSLYDPARMAVSVRDGGTIPRARINGLLGKKCEFSASSS